MSQAEEPHQDTQGPVHRALTADRERGWASAVDHAPVGLAVLDETGRILRANACMGHLVGRHAQAVVGVDFGSLVLANDRESWLRDRSEVVRHGRTVFDRERRIFRPDGMLIWLSLSVAPIVHEDRDARMMLSAADVSGRRCLQEAFNRGQAELRELVESRTTELRAAHLRLRLADRMAAMGTLGAGLGHDMNNVLLPVRAHINALAAMADGDGVDGHLTAIRQSLAYLQQLADGLHFLAMDPERENGATRTDLTEWWAEVEAILPKALSRGITFACDLPDGLPPIDVPPHRLTQAILNLIVNAGEAIRPRRAPRPDGSGPDGSDGDGVEPAKRGRGHVRLWAEAVGSLGRKSRDVAPGPSDAAAIRIGVTDNGSGMQPEVVRRAGTLYYTTKSRGMGTGLGLALVRMVADRSGGTMDIDSTPGEGTTVSLTLPVAGQSRPDPAETMAGRRAAPAAPTRTTESGVPEGATEGDDR